MKKISTKINVSILAICVLILAFVGCALVINMTVDYHRAFEKSVSRVLNSQLTEVAANEGKAALDGFLQSEYAALCDDCEREYYILENGNVIFSSADGGMLTPTDNLYALSSGKAAVIPSITAKVLDYGKNYGTLTVYVTDNKSALYDRIFDISVLFLQALALAVLLAAVISYFVSKRLTASLKTLADGAKKMASGEFEKIKVNSRDEIGGLCDIFNEMGAQIQSDFDEFEKVEISRREFVANVSHELKTPLTVIKSYSQTLGGMEVDDNTRREFLCIIDSEADRMSDIVGQLLTLSKLEHPSPVNITDCDVYTLCKKTAEALLPQADKKQVKIKVDGNAVIKTDSSKLGTIITNLMSNAVNYSENGGEVRVIITNNSVAVTNGGAGISKADLPHIFDRFYRTDPARQRSTGGTGLGLAIAKASADAIGARLYAKSDPDALTVFTLEF